MTAVTPTAHPAAATVGDDWRARALCVGIDPADFFPESPGEVPYEITVLCRACPVSDDCFLYGLHHEDYGIWGGVSEVERRRVRRRNGIRLDVPQGPRTRGVEIPADVEPDEPEADWRAW